MTVGVQMLASRIRLLTLVFALVGCVGSAVSAEQTLKVRVHGLSGLQGVWLGVVGDDPDAAEWRFSESGNFEVPASLSERTVLMAVAKDRVPLVLRNLSVTPSDRHEVHLSTGLAIKGTVVSEDGLPLTGAKITFVSDGVDGIAVPLYVRPMWTTSAGGAFHIWGLEPRRYAVEATAEGHLPLVLEDVVIQQEGVNRLEFELSRAFYVGGRVFDTDGGHASGIEVVAQWLDRPRVAVQSQGTTRSEVSERVDRRYERVLTGDDGSYRHGPFEAATNVKVYARSPGSSSSKRHEVSAPYEDLDLRLPSEVIRGRVLDSSTAILWRDLL